MKYRNKRALARYMRRSDTYRRIRKCIHLHLPYTPALFCAQCVVVAGLILSVVAVICTTVLACASGRGQSACILLFVACSGLFTCTGWLLWLVEYSRIVGPRETVVDENTLREISAE